jgi:fatty-acyl-CoA synthase
VTKRQLVVAGLGASALLGYAFLKSKSTDLPRDFRAILKLLHIKRKLATIHGENKTTADLWQECVQKWPNKEAIIFIDKPEHLAARKKTVYTFAELDAESNKVANWALNEGFQPKDTVALMMDNRPEFVIMWLAMAKLGVVTSLINFNLRGGPLRHSLQVCNAKVFFIGHEHTDVITRQLREELGGRWFSVSGPGGEGLEDLDAKVSALNNATPIPRTFRGGLKSTDTLFYIYTSGTTGNPKAAKISHLRFMMVGTTFGLYFNMSPADRIYTPLPLYHSAAGLIGMGSSWVSGATILIRHKFSAQSFWPDVREYRATIVQYIGELCRYLLGQPPSPTDGQHGLRLALGNGLRPDIWEEFQRRFKIPQIGEFYAATEGNVGLINSFNKVGAVGYIPPLIQPFFPACLVRFDVENEMPLRDPKTGYCCPCQPGEVGEMLGLIEEDDPLRQFLGYTDTASTEKKVMRNVFKKGDMYFRTGDLLRMDKEGYVFFVDRIGDTFRWKGENVATTEVAEVLMTGGLGLAEVNVYGVKVPNKDGRAGMACILPQHRDALDLDKLYKVVKSELPSYAAPLFLRVIKEGAMDVTSTFKHKKTDLVEQGFNPDVVKDELYFRDDAKGKYVPLDKALYQKIVSQEFSAKL